MKKIIIIALTAFFATTLSAATIKGTYIPKDTLGLAESLYEKLVFSGSKVKMYMGGIKGMSLGVSFEYSYKLSGNTLSIGTEAGSVEFTYNKDKNEIALLAGYGGTGGTVWGKQGTFNQNNPYPEKGKEKTVSSEQVKKEQDKTITEQVSNTKGETWNYNPYTFYQKLAEECAEYSEKVYNIGHIQQQLKNDGYTGFEYNYNTDEDGIGFAFAYKKVNDSETLLAVVIRGTVGNEWFGNMDIGNGILAYHESFRQATDDLQQTLNNYIGKNKLNNINFLITGHSRGAAVANILAADLDNGNFKVNGKNKVFCYGFATPNYCKDLKDDGYNYNNIFNFCFNDDFVTRVPLDEWGYGKLGITYWAVADGLYAVNTEFKQKVSGHSDFYFDAVKKLLPEIIKVSPTIDDYNKKNLNMGFGHNPQHIPLRLFMRNYIAQAKIDGEKAGSAVWGLFVDMSPFGNDVNDIAAFFVQGSGMKKEVMGYPIVNMKNYIADTHAMKTYQSALIANGFLTQ